ncbi:MAG: LysR family transcriptional regulator [Anaerococcus hydrogenalis]|uniref:LysR family transcriptional regulator n=1 Tax=Anaerococcus hydrogenalis TaxID=33029 RepID=UPI002902FBDA|nr:LysR family transcriptional regulator [Anaerococcus hydrogenalis]MDU1315537.1 LysR family transcriptional regulator [Anaerococcus hydrogenalis]MDU2202050.1 LysR family transcriptional regulator [Anaerococcus hydrogenalis]MDU2582515.1 LysR family transcriptional regulator [Anaerococcus hydrogenalis]MDU3199015.1 LysR family transcriptional regulator [Anaerococcus hydrogenalis]MDU3688618.1 LysR family transcriptional regulator [Anaerococcus hydrogenalis]
MNLNKIYYAIEVSKTGSISKAAKNLYTSQPAISMAINDLEKELGFKIFQRSQSGTQTTSKGLEYLIKCQDLISKYKEIQRQYCSDNNDISELRISSQHFNFAVSAFMKLIEKYKDSPFKFYLKETTSLHAINHVENDYSDLSFIYINKSYREAIFNLFKEKSLTYVSIAKVIPHVFINKDHPLANKKLIKISDLYDYPMIIYEQDDTQILPEEFVNLPNHKQVIYTQDRGTTLGLISNTNSFNVGTGCLHPSNGFSNIKTVKLENPENLSMDIGYVYKSSKNLSKLCKEYLNLTKLELLNCLPNF